MTMSCRASPMTDPPSPAMPFPNEVAPLGAGIRNPEGAIADPAETMNEEPEVRWDPPRTT